MALPGLLDTLLHSCQLEGAYYDCLWHDDDDDDDEVFCGMVGRQKAFSLISTWDHFQRYSLSWISGTHTHRAGFEPAQNLSSDLGEWSCAVVITTTPRRHHGAKWRTENTIADLNSGIAFIVLFSQKKYLRWKEIHTHIHTHTHTHTYNRNATCPGDESVFLEVEIWIVSSSTSSSSSSSTSCCCYNKERRKQHKDWTP